MRPLTLAALVRGHGATVVAMAAGALVTVLGSMLPWLRTGSRQRNSYDAFAVTDRLGFGPGGAAAEGLRFWPLVPLLTAAAVVAAWWGWRRPGGAVGVLAGLYAAAVGIAVATADATAVDIRPGALVTAVGGGLLLLASIATLVVGSPRQPTASEPTH